MSAPLECYLRTYRKRSGLSQDEAAFLLGSANGANVSRYEQLDRQPDLRIAFAYEVIFRVPVRHLFAGLYLKVEKETIARARLLTQKIAEAGARRTTLRNLPVLEFLTSELAAPQPEQR
jgi:transcriptional regulator with XRE-family HTH domain